MFTIRPASHGDEPFIFPMLYAALFVPPGREPFSRSVLEEPQIAYYASGFGRRAGDIGFIAEAGGEPIGAAWVRLLQAEDPGYGYVDDDTPELTIAVTPEWRGQGVGTALAAKLLESVPRMSLSSDARNPATELYRRLGFEVVTSDATSVTMLRYA